MSVKKLLLLSAAGIATVAAGAAVAGGPDVAPPPPVMSGFYVEAQLGYAWEDWNGIIPPIFGVITTDNADGGFTVGGDLGYQFNNNWSLEVGGYYLVSRPRFTIAGVGSFKITDWFIYLAPKLMVHFPWISGLDWYFKAGVAYRRLTADDFTGGIMAAGGDHVDYVRPIFGSGMQYVFDFGLILGAQYLYVPGRAGQAPDIHQLTGTLGYLFAM